MARPFGLKVAQVCELVREACPGAWFVPVYFNHGDRRVQELGSITFGKAFLVSHLQMLLETARLHLPRVAGAFRVGNQDDRVTALGLAVHVDPGHRPLMTREGSLPF